MMKHLIYLLIVVAPLVAKGQWTTTTVKITSGSNTANAQLYLPPSYNVNDEKKYPFIFSAHGFGEGHNSGSYNVSRILQAGLPKAVVDGNTPAVTVEGTTYEFIILAPQFSIQISPTSFPFIIKDILEKLKSTSGKYKIDTLMMFTTGYSGGGLVSPGVISQVSTNDSTIVKKFSVHVPHSPALNDVNKPELAARAQRYDAYILGFAGALSTSGEASFREGAQDLQAQVNAATDPDLFPYMILLSGHGHSGFEVPWGTSYSIPGLGYNVYEYLVRHSKRFRYPPSENEPPLANAGSNQSITLPTNSVTLSGSGTDSDGTVVSYSWSKISGGSATIVSPTSATTNVTGLSAGTYVFRLTVTDNAGATGSADVTVIVYAAGEQKKFITVEQRRLKFEK